MKKLYTVLCITNTGRILCRTIYKRHSYAIKCLNRYLADPNFSKSLIVTTHL